MTISEATMSNLKIWLNEAISWLFEDGSTTALQHPHEQLVNLMIAAKNENHNGPVWDRIDELKKLIPHMPETREQAEAYIKCAETIADLEDIADALQLLQAAESKYISYPHQRAVALWMMGCIYWLTYQKVDAISSWQEAISIFHNRYQSVQFDPAKIDWYKNKVDMLISYLDLALANEELPLYNQNPNPEPVSSSAANPPAESTTDLPEEPTGPTPGSSPVSDPPASLAPNPVSNPTPDHQPDLEDADSIRWLSCFISDSVPAGGFGPVGFDPNPTGYLEFTEVRIEDAAYEIHSIKRKSIRRNTVNIDSLTGYRTVRVRGTSMNAARPVPINDGDYILIHQQNPPGDNEIVVAEIIGYDVLATVKRLNYRNGKIQLIPESTDQQHYDNPDWGKEWNWNEIRFVGVVEAVFKKKPQ